jgi:hypothetical protein
VINPSPQFTGMTPSAVPVHYPTPQATFPLTINGSNFLTGATVTVAGTPRTPTSLSANQITLTMQSTDTQNVGSVLITITNPAPSAGPVTVGLQVNPPGTCSLVSTYSGDGNYAFLDAVGTKAEWAAPIGATVAKDPTSGYRCLFVCDTDDQRIRMVYLEGPNTGLSVAIAGTGVAGFDPGGAPALQTRLNGPRGICARNDANGNLLALYISDCVNHMIRELIPGTPSSNTNWLLGQFAGTGTAGLLDGDFESAEFNFPRGIYTGIDNFIYVADTSNGAIRQIDFSGDALTIVHPSSPALSPFGITASHNSNLLYFSDLALQGIYSLTRDGVTLTAVAGNGTAGSTDGNAGNAHFQSPTELCWTTDPGGAEVLYIADMSNHKIRKLAIATAQVSTFAGTGAAGFQDGGCNVSMFQYPRCVTTGINGEFYVTDTSNNRIRIVQ